MTKGSKAPVFGAVRQAHRTGRGAPPLISQPIRKLIERPLAEVRSALKIPEPDRYRACHSIWRAEGIDAYDLLASKAPAELELLAA
jgi:ubiquinone biosynthesis protein COQ4